MCFISLDTKIQRNIPLSLKDFLKINNEAIGIHERYLAGKDDTDATGTNQEHKDWIFFYQEAISLVKNGYSSLSISQIIGKYKEDANIHLRYINEGLTNDTVGGINWQSKWYWRWVACSEFVSRFVDNRVLQLKVALGIL